MNFSMLVVVLGSHLAAGLVGVGMSVLIFSCANVASSMNARAAAAPGLASIGWHTCRVLFGLIFVASVSFPWLYLLVVQRISMTVFASLALCLVVSALLFIKFRTFGAVTFIGI